MQARIEKLVYGGSGLARTGQGVLFIEHVLPGEFVEAGIIEQKKDFARARPEAILEASPARRAPTCPNFETVGCCDWAFIEPASQLALKEAILRESLARLGQIEWNRPIDTIRSPEDGYRLRAVFRVAGGKPGFIREGSHDVVPIARCASLMPELNAFLTEAAEALPTSPLPDTDTIRAVASPTTGEIAAVFSRGSAKVRWGAPYVMAEVNGLRFRVRPAGFFQPNRHVLAPLQERVVRLAGRGERALDLFSGDGFFSLALARVYGRVVGVDRRATHTARRNAMNNRLSNVAFVRAPARAFLSTTDMAPDLIVLDPPRSGTGRDMSRRIARLGAGKIIYVSCNPTTFAADARAFVADGYQLTHLELIDQFPNTHHIETIAMLER